MGPVLAETFPCQLEQRDTKPLKGIGTWQTKGKTAFILGLVLHKI